MTVELLNIDCMEYMAGCADNSFDLAIVDPPYAVGACDGKFGGKKGHESKVYAWHNGKKYVNWDTTPSDDYFIFLFRISKNQIIWGSNYYPESLYHSGAIVWVKKNGGPLSDCEIAFQSFNKLVKRYDQQWSGFLKGGEKSLRIHPNQKPIALYNWLLENYAVKGQRILDTHLGSGSSAIAAHYFGADFVWAAKSTKTIIWRRASGSKKKRASLNYLTITQRISGLGLARFLQKNRKNRSSPCRCANRYQAN